MKKLLFSIAVICSLQSVVSQTFGDGILNYIGTSGSTVKVTGGAGGVCPTGALTIPDTVDYNSTIYTVTAVGEEAFKQCGSLTSIIFPSSLTSIGAYAFYNCRGFTGSLTLPNSLTSIGDYAFYYCWNFSGSLTLPSMLTSIGEYAFYDCTGFTGSLTIPSTLTSINNFAFYNCSGFTGSLTIPSTLTSISAGAFNDCSGFTGSLTLPSTMTSIADYLFQAVDSQEALRFPLC